MIGNAFQLQGNSPHLNSPRGNRTSRQSLYPLCIRKRVPYCRIPGDGFSQYRLSGRFDAWKHSFDSPMLITELYFQVENLFTMALKTKMPRFDNPCMNGPNRNLMDLFSFHSVKRIILHISNRLQTGMTDGGNPML